MKYIIRESQYSRIINEERIEFPGIEYFNDDWGLVEKSLNRFTYKGKQYSKTDDLIKDYYINKIREIVLKYGDEYGDDTLLDLAAMNLGLYLIKRIGEEYHQIHVLGLHSAWVFVEDVEDNELNAYWLEYDDINPYYMIVSIFEHIEVIDYNEDI
jgi:hypothetical protein